jgi:hypothetical protein
MIISRKPFFVLADSKGTPNIIIVQIIIELFLK